jgi:hypothetical protein
MYNYKKDFCDHYRNENLLAEVNIYNIHVLEAGVNIPQKTVNQRCSKEMSSLYFGLDVFCQFEARVPEFDAVFSVHYTRGREGLCVKFWDSNLK